jgi:hypothetical protein
MRLPTTLDQRWPSGLAPNHPRHQLKARSAAAQVSVTTIFALAPSACRSQASATRSIG